MTSTISQATRSKWAGGSRALLQGLSVCCLALFCFTVYSRPTTWYSQDKAFVRMRNAMTINLTSVPILTRVRRGCSEKDAWIKLSGPGHWLSACSHQPTCTHLSIVQQEVIKNNKTVTELAGRNAVLVSGSSLFPVSPSACHWSADVDRCCVFAAISIDCVPSLACTLAQLVLVWSATLGIAICGSGLVYLAQLARLQFLAGDTAHQSMFGILPAGCLGCSLHLKRVFRKLRITVSH